MTMNNVLLKAAVVAGLGAGFAVTSQATLIFNFNNLLTGDPPAGTGPWATLTIDDIAPDTVRLVLTHNASSAQGQFISKLLLNLTSVPGNITGIGPFDAKLNGPPQFGEDAFPDASYRFDVKIDFHVSNANNGALRLKPGESVTVDIFGTGLNENSFFATADGSQGPIYGLIHLQGINGEGSAKLDPDVIPEPATLLAVGAGLAGLVARRRRK